VLTELKHVFVCLLVINYQTSAMCLTWWDAQKDRNGPCLHEDYIVLEETANNNEIVLKLGIPITKWRK
jgi:hypothetical protein